MPGTSTSTLGMLSPCLSSLRRLARACSHGAERFQERFNVQVSFKCLFVSMFTNVQLFKASHMDGPDSKSGEIAFSVQKDFQLYFARASQCTGVTWQSCGCRRGRICNHVKNFILPSSFKMFGTFHEGKSGKNWGYAIENIHHHWLLTHKYEVLSGWSNCKTMLLSLKWMTKVRIPQSLLLLLNRFCVFNWQGNSKHCL